MPGTKKIQTMKTKIIIQLTIILLLQMGFTIEAGAGESSTTDTAAFAFSTGDDSSNQAFNPMFAMPVPEPEAYIDDIPFNTRNVWVDHFTGLCSTPDPEPVANDIPFSTCCIAARYLPLSDCGIKVDAEKAVSDIPFNTKRIAAKIIKKKLNRKG
jgi:hypothetical protein